MTNLQAGVLFGMVDADSGSKSACDHTDDKSGWRCNLEGKTAGALIDNIERDRSKAKPVWPPPGGTNSVHDATKTNWPSEAHHLIPWQMIAGRAGHKVKQYLKRGTYLIADANYSINHGNNGKFMPFASDLKEWKGTESVKAKVAFDLMDRVGIQLHQSRHSYESYGGNTEGYKTIVTELLDTIRLSESRHRDKCEECKTKADDKKFPPRKQMTHKMDKVSKSLETQIGRGKIFVSRRAHAWWTK
jgi:hypothetical protein